MYVRWMSNKKKMFFFGKLIARGIVNFLAFTYIYWSIYLFTNEAKNKFKLSFFSTHLPSQKKKRERKKKNGKYVRHVCTGVMLESDLFFWSSFSLILVLNKTLSSARLISPACVVVVWISIYFRLHTNITLYIYSSVYIYIDRSSCCPFGGAGLGYFFFLCCYFR